MKRLEALYSRIIGFGLPAVIGSVLIAAVALVYATIVVPLYEETSALRTEIADTRARISGRVSPAEMRGEALSSFYSYFPRADSAPLWLGKIYDAAAQSGITLTSGEYEFQRTDGTRLGRYRISLPAHGSYEQIRRFIATVLHEVPAASLDDISLRREDIASPDVEARLRLTLYMETAP